MSEHDLRLRGPGEFFGYRQSGDMKFSKADIIADHKILEIARDDALEILLDKTSYQKEEYKRLFVYLKSVLKSRKLD